LMAEGSDNKLYSAGFDYNFGFRFFGTLKSIYARNRSAHYIDSLNVSDYRGTSDGQQIIRYTTNHDVNGSDGTPQELFGGEKGSLAAFVVVAYMKSVPMIYNGQEVGTPYRLTFPFTSKKIDWTLNPQLTTEYKKIIAFRNKNAAIRRGRLTSYTSDDVCAFTKKIKRDEVFVLSNLRNKAINFELPSGLKNSKWKDGLAGGKVSLKKSVRLEPYGYLILKK
jgi:glycosidase